MKNKLRMKGQDSAVGWPTTPPTLELFRESWKKDWPLPIYIA